MLYRIESVILAILLLDSLPSSSLYPCVIATGPWTDNARSRGQKPEASKCTALSDCTVLHWTKPLNHAPLLAFRDYIRLTEQSTRSKLPWDALKQFNIIPDKIVVKVFVGPNRGMVNSVLFLLLLSISPRLVPQGIPWALVHSEYIWNIPSHGSNISWCGSANGLAG